MTKHAARNLAILSLILLSLLNSTNRGYENFKVSVYSRAYETREMNDVSWIEPRWTELTRQVHVDKVYLETHRDLIVVNEATLNAAKKFFADRGVQTAGGITLTVNERNRFETFCYTNPEHRRKVREIIEYTARQFDEMTKPITLVGGTTVQPTTIARAAGYTFEKVDKFLGRLGKPVGVESYKPYHSTGEDFLHNYLGMCGIPMDLVPEFPVGEKMILLTECAKFDPAIVEKIKSQLVAGRRPRWKW